MEKVSIIIPIYKVEQYLAECLDSVIGQSYTNLEIILVDDGSPDNCPAICDDYAKKDDRIIVIHQENAGVSVARNVGIDLCTGEWIMFVDPDDVVNQDIVKVLQDHADSETEIIQCQYSKRKDIMLESDGEIRYDIKSYNAKTLLFHFFNPTKYPLEEKNTKISLNTQIYMTPWGKMYSANAIKNNNIRFAEKLHPHEDSLFLYQLFMCINSYQCVSFIGYWYNVNPGSIMNHQKTMSAAENYLKLRESISSLQLKDDLEFAEAVRVKNISESFKVLLILAQIRKKEEMTKKDVKEIKKRMLREISHQLTDKDKGATLFASKQTQVCFTPVIVLLKKSIFFLLRDR